MVATIVDQTPSAMAQPVSPLHSTQTTAGTSTSSGPSWAMHSMNITAVSRPATGTPAAATPMPPSTACTSAVTPTPSATPRMAPPARSTMSLARSPPMRRASRRTSVAASSPVANITAAMTTVSRNCSTSTPTLPTSDTNQRVRLPA